MFSFLLQHSIGFNFFLLVNKFVGYGKQCGLVVLRRKDVFSWEGHYCLGLKVKVRKGGRKDMEQAVGIILGEFNELLIQIHVDEESTNGVLNIEDAPYR